VTPERDQLRVGVQLVDAVSGDAYDRTSFVVPRDAVLALQDSLAESVERFLRRGIGDELVLRERKAGASDSRAWLLVQRATRLNQSAVETYGTRGPDAADSLFVAADSMLAAAEGLDPAWAEPVALRAEIALQRATISRDAGAALRTVDGGMVHAERALALDPRSAAALEARGSLRTARMRTGLVTSQKAMDELVAAAESDLRSAVDIDPSRATAWNQLSILQYGKLDVPQSNYFAQQAYEADAFLTAAPDIVWRLFATSYDMEQFPSADRWCGEGRRRFHEDARFVLCGLLMLTSKGRPPVIADAWRLKEELRAVTPPSLWDYQGREADMLVAGTIGRAGYADSARAVMLRARAGRDVDPRGELWGYEAFARTLVGDRDEAIELLERYLTANPDHRAGFGKVNAWWWRDLQGDLRFRNLAGVTK
jgi:tetratricopeptide (TPR) repeat protein